MSLIDYDMMLKDEKISSLIEKKNPLLKFAFKIALEIETAVLNPTFAQGFGLAPSLAAGNGKAGKSFGKVLGHPILRAVMAGVSVGVVRLSLIHI